MMCMARHVVDPPEDPHQSREEALESVADRRGITVEELKRRRRIAGIDSSSEDDGESNQEARVEG